MSARRLANRLRRLREWLTERSVYTLTGPKVANACAALEEGRALPYDQVWRTAQPVGELRAIVRLWQDKGPDGKWLRHLIGERGLDRVSSVLAELVAYQRGKVRA